MKQSLDFVIPVFNPSEGWEIEVIKAIIEVSRKFNNLSINPIIVNDGTSRSLTKDFSELKKATKSCNPSFS